MSVTPVLVVIMLSFALGMIVGFVLGYFASGPE